MYAADILTDYYLFDDKLPELQEFISEFYTETLFAHNWEVVHVRENYVDIKIGDKTIGSYYIHKESSEEIMQIIEQRILQLAFPSE